MAKVYFPDAAIMVVASPPHPPNTQYRVLSALRLGGGTNHRVIKVHMVFEGKVADRRTPSYPVGSPDYTRVGEAIRKLTNMR